MAFRIKDLLINLSPGEGANPGGGQFRRPLFGGCFPELLSGDCTGTPQHTFTLFTPWLSPLCCQWSATGPLTPFTPVFQGGGDPASSAEQLAILKAQLKQALVDIENREKALEETLEPQTAAQIEELEGKLEEALTELRRRKSELKKK
jgi:hypothetical protein